MKLEQLLAYEDYKDGLKALYEEYNLKEFGYKTEEINEEDYKEGFSDSPEERRKQIEDNKFLKDTYGWDMTELWNLDDTFFKFILPRLYVFYKLDYTWDQDYGEDGSFKNILENILEALLNVLYTNEGFEEAEHNEQKINKGMLLLGKYIRRLWN